jgi:hypothetical protein
MIEGWRVDRRVFMALRRADFAALMVGGGGIVDGEVEVEGGTMLR